MDSSNSDTEALLASQILTLSRSIISRIETIKHDSTEVKILTEPTHTVHDLASTLSTWKVQDMGTTSVNSTDTMVERPTMLFGLQLVALDMRELSEFLDGVMSKAEAVKRKKFWWSQGIFRMGIDIATGGLAAPLVAGAVAAGATTFAAPAINTEYKESREKHRIYEFKSSMDQTILILRTVIAIIDSRQPLSAMNKSERGSGHLDVLLNLLVAKAGVNAAAGYGGRIALQAAAEGGHLDVVQKLLDVNAAVATRGVRRAALQAATERETRLFEAQMKSPITQSTQTSRASKPFEVEQNMYSERDIAQNAAKAKLEDMAASSTTLEVKQRLPPENPAPNAETIELEAISGPSTTMEAKQHLSEETLAQNVATPQLKATSGPSTILERRLLPPGNLSQSATNEGLDNIFLLSPEAITVFVVAVAVLTIVVPILQMAKSFVVQLTYLLGTHFQIMWTLAPLLLSLTLMFSGTISSLVKLCWLKYMSSLGDACLAASWTRLAGVFHRWGRPNVPEGCERIFWICSCGEMLYADIEKQSIPADVDHVTPSTELLESGSYRPSGTTTSEPSQATPANQSGETSTARSRSSAGTLEGSMQLQEGNSNTRLGTRIEFQLREKGFLLMCVNTERSVTELSHVETTYIGNDYIFFSNIRAEYEQRRNRLGFWTLFIPTKVSLVQFELVPINRPKGSFVGISEVPSLPPPEFVQTQKLYHYAPCPVKTPAQIRTFLPEQPFRHLFFNPHDCRESWWLNRLPTKLKSKLLFDPSTPTVGWGIHFEEGLNMGAVTCLTVAIMLLSWLLSIIWSKIRKDVSGAFGMGSFLVSAGTLVLTVLFAYKKELY